MFLSSKNRSNRMTRSNWIFILDPLEKSTVDRLKKWNSKITNTTTNKKMNKIAHLMSSSGSEEILLRRESSGVVFVFRFFHSQWTHASVLVLWKSNWFGYFKHRSYMNKCIHKCHCSLAWYDIHVIYIHELEVQQRNIYGGYIFHIYI